jgi:hypothetical protein
MERKMLSHTGMKDILAWDIFYFTELVVQISIKKSKYHPKSKNVRYLKRIKNMNIPNTAPTKNATWMLYGVLGLSQLVCIFVFEEFIYVEEIEGMSNILPVLAAITMVIAFISHNIYKKASSLNISEEQLQTIPAYRDAVDMIEADKMEEFKSSHEVSFRMTGYVLCWALGELVTIMGISGYYLGINKPYNYFFFGAGILLHLLHRPIFKK